MSWDVLLHASEQTPPRVEEMPDDWTWVPRGNQQAVRAAISAVLPGTDWTDPQWGIYIGGNWSIEFNVGSEEPVEHLMLHVRGTGPVFLNIQNLLSRTGWYALDLSASEWLHHCDDPEAGWIGFQEYRDRVMDAYPEKSNPEH